MLKFSLFCHLAPLPCLRKLPPFVRWSSSHLLHFVLMSLWPDWLIVQPLRRFIAQEQTGVASLSCLTTLHSPFPCSFSPPRAVLADLVVHRGAQVHLYQNLVMTKVQWSQLLV